MQYTDSTPSRIAVDGPLSNNDFFEIDKITYRALTFNNDDPLKGSGKNSTIFRAILADGSFSDELILKVSNYAEGRTTHASPLRRERFEREIRAYRKIEESGQTQWSVSFIGDGYIRVGENQHRCFLIEKADQTLKDFLLRTPDILLQQRLLLCYDILRAFACLHEIGIYHRDIKPDNLFIADGALKIGDLGLVSFRVDDASIDQPRERIGPIWWMAPEAVNRHLRLMRADCDFIETTVGSAADIYQLGKLFWFIIQGDVPNGVVSASDMRLAGTDVFGTILKPLLNYKTSARPSLADIIKRMEPLRRHYGF
jgi:serine/threonine protein kinase